MYGIMMLLPQSSAFAALKNRLNSVSSIGYLHVSPRRYVFMPAVQRLEQKAKRGRFCEARQCRSVAPIMTDQTD